MDEGGGRRRLFLFLSYGIFGLLFFLGIILVDARGWSYRVDMGEKDLGGGHYVVEKRDPSYIAWIGVFQQDEDTCKNGVNKMGDDSDCDKIIDLSVDVSHLKEEHVHDQALNDYIAVLRRFEDGSHAAGCLFIAVITLCIIQILLACLNISPRSVFVFSVASCVALLTVNCEYPAVVPGGKFDLHPKANPANTMTIDLKDVYIISWCYYLSVMCTLLSGTASCLHYFARRTDTYTSL